ncbi:glycosyltransferase family 2 protein [Candidatus Woesearchaeota archaeon]|nr:glycosyltransferase family 2 protein [Candidatus Woesearchaeota archaeon]
MTGHLKFSVVIPTYNRAKIVIECIKCVAVQNYPKDSYEIVVVNDGSKDNTTELIESYLGGIPNLKLVNQTNKGPAAARNTGWQNAKNEIVAFTDDDCRPEPDWLLKLAQYFHKEPDLIGVGGIMYTPEDEIKIMTHHSLPIDRAIIEQAPFPGTNNVAYKRSALEKVNGFDGNVPYVSAEDFDLYVRIIKLGNVIYDVNLAMPHISRPMTWKQGMNTYKNFYLGFKAFEKKHPEEFKKMYQRKTSQGLFTKDSNILTILRRSIKYYFPDILNPVLAFKVVTLYIATRIYLVSCWFTRT